MPLRRLLATLALAALSARYLARDSKPPHAPRKRIATFDLETDGFSERVIYAGAFDGDDYIATPHLSELFDWMYQRRKTHLFYAHNLPFDVRYLVGPLSERWTQAVPVFSGGRLIQLKVRFPDHSTLEMRDSYALCPTTLDALLAAFCPDLPKLSRANGFEDRPFDPMDDSDLDYLRRDCEGLYHALVQLTWTIRETFDVYPRLTAAATALAAWQRTMPEGFKLRRLRKEAEEFCRRGYRGGLCYIADYDEHADCETVDINATYAAVMHTYAMTTGVAYWTAPGEFHDDETGFYEVDIWCPNPDAPALVPSGPGASRYVHQRDNVVLTTLDLAYLREAGYDWYVRRGLSFTNTTRMFDEFVDRCARLESAYARGSAQQTVAKLMRNSLYGKFGAKPERLEYRYLPDDADLTDGWFPVFRDDNSTVPGFYFRAVESDRPYIRPDWAALITAGARRNLIRVCGWVGWEHVLYTDTDSVTASASAIEAARLPFAPIYGLLKREKSWRTFRVNGAKNYEGIDASEQFTARWAGVPRRVSAWFAQQKRDAEWAAPTTYQTFARTGKFEETRSRSYNPRL